MIVAEALRLAALGVALGGLALFVTLRFIDQMLYGVTSFDVPTLAGVLTTCYVRRATCDVRCAARNLVARGTSHVARST